MLRKGLHLFLIVVMLSTIFFPLSLKAEDNRTLQDLIDELEILKEDLRVVNDEQKLTEARINEIKANIARINREIMEIDATIERLTLEIEQLNKDIELKDEEIKRIIHHHQLTNGSNAYVEYIVGASTVTDFIFRLAIVEQMTEYNKTMIEKMNQMIEEAIQKGLELEQQKISANNKRQSLFAEQIKLGGRVNELNEHEVSLEKEIEDARKTIDNYKKYFNCQPHQRLKDCASFPIDSTFVRPLARGAVTSEFGWRIHPITKQNRFHSGIDIGGNPVGTYVYPIAAGRVVFVGYFLCGGNYVTVQHNVNGQYYASRYLHLSRVHVRVGQEVFRETPIGGIGGADFKVDICSTGAHLHMDVARGIYGQDFVSFSNSGPVIDPRSVVNFPPLCTRQSCVRFYGRF